MEKDKPKQDNCHIEKGRSEEAIMEEATMHNEKGHNEQTTFEKQVLMTAALWILFGGHPLKLERYRED